MEIKIEKLKKIYGQNTVIDIPELTLHKGELVGLVGNNGDASHARPYSCQRGASAI